MRVVIIDDEANSRDSIKRILQISCPSVELIGEAESVESGYECIVKNQPDVAILDIKMPDGTGFDLLNKFTTVDFKVIFVTAFEEYAIKAFKFNAIDYVTKPVDSYELKQAIDRTEESLNGASINDAVKLLLESVDKVSHSNLHKKIVLRTLNTIHVIEIGRIVRCESDRNYTVFHIIGEDKILVSRSMKEYDELLEEHGFFRIHNSHLINLNFVRKFFRDELIVSLSDNTSVPVSYRKRDELINALNSL